MRETTPRTTKRNTYVGVFDERDDAELAARDLREQGFKDDQIGYAWRDESGKTHQEGNKAGKMAASGAGTGVVLGGIIGAGAALLIPGIGPVVSGGLGIPEDEAKYYDERFKDGRTLMTVRADDRYDDASGIVRRRRGYDYETRGDRALDESEQTARETETRT